MHRFFVPAENLGPGELHFSTDDAHHIHRVLRLTPGACCIAVSPGGFEYLVELGEVTAAGARGRILSRQRAAGEPPLRVTLVQALARGEKMDLVVQKAAELGVSRIIPVVTERCVVQLDHARAASRRDRWQKIARSAAAQSRRPLVPPVSDLCQWGEALRVPGPALLAYEGEQCRGLKATLRDLPPTGNLAVFVGPEGGFAPGEVDEAIAAGLRPVSLGPRILRAETAAVALLAAIMYELGDLGCPGPGAGPGTP